MAEDKYEYKLSDSMIALEHYLFYLFASLLFLNLVISSKINKIKCVDSWIKKQEREEISNNDI